MKDNRIKLNLKGENSLLESLGYLAKMILQKIVETCVRDRNKGDLAELKEPLSCEEFIEKFREEFERIEEKLSEIENVSL